MQLGFFTMPIHPLEKDWRQTLREDREAFILADELGFSEAYVGEHTTDQAENITSCVLFLASLVGRTRQMRLGTLSSDRGSAPGDSRALSPCRPAERGAPCWISKRSC
jgi:hypothetical protein